MTCWRNFFSNYAVATLTQLLSVSFPASFANSFSYTLDSIHSLGLPVMTIETEDGEEPTCEYVDPPEGMAGYGIRNATKVPGTANYYLG